MKTVGVAEVENEAKHHHVVKTVGGAEIEHEAKHHGMKTVGGAEILNEVSIMYYFSSAHCLHHIMKVEFLNEHRQLPL